MKKSIIVLTLVTAMNLGFAQERLSQDEALKYATLIGSNAKQLKATPIATDVDIKQPVGVKDEGYGGLVLPQKNLTAETLSSVSEQVVPIGQIWFHKLTLMKDGEPLPESKLLMASFSHEGEEIRVPQCALGVRRNKDGALELLVYGKGKDAVIIVPLKPDTATLSTPIDVQAERESDSGRVTLKILGKYKASITVTALQQ